MYCYFLNIVQGTLIKNKLATNYFIIDLNYQKKTNIETKYLFFGNWYFIKGIKLTVAIKIIHF